MKTASKRARAILAFGAYAVTVIAGLGFSFEIKASAAESGKEGLTYFYSGLLHNPRAERVYKAFESIENSGSFKTGIVDYNATENGVFVAEDVEAYVEQGNSKVPVAFSAGRDAYLMDNPDLFYWDLFSVSLSAGVQNGAYVAYFDTSRTENTYLGDIDTEQEIITAVNEYEAAIKVVVDGAKAAGSDAKTQIEYVNKYIAENTEYSFGTEIIDGHNVSTPAAAYVSTSYGALVNGKAICGGYAKAFKAVLDRLEIPCVCIQGYGLSGGSSEFIAHMWNAVKVDGQWYGVDPTWNDTSGKLDKWMLVGSKAMAQTHVEDNVVSSSGYQLQYPALKPYNYGNDTDDNGMDIKGEYSDSSDNTGKILKITVTYEGKGAKKLQDEGKHLAFRMGDKNADGTVEWGYWFSFVEAQVEFAGFAYNDTESFVMMHAGIQFIQFALIDYAPDIGIAGSEHKVYYNPETLTDEHISKPSAPYQNEGYGSYIPSPGANATPSNTGSLDVNGTYNMKFVYSDKLVLAEGKKLEDVKLSVTTSRGNDTINDSCEITNFKWDGNKTITFTLKPSKMFIHIKAIYSFVPTNLVGERSNKIPDPVTYTFKGKSVVCSKIFNDGRLYMNVYGEPQMLDTSDLSVSDFKDENGNYYAKEQRSQLLLVADRPGNAKSEQMKDMLETEEGIAKENVITTATYEISLHVCGVVQQVPKGSYMQVKFGFPEGFSPDDAGTTFKIYHYKSENGQIVGVEEIPVIITEYGLIAKVESFSPFTVVQVKKSAVTESSAKNIYASVSGNGGQITAENGTGGIQTVESDNIVYNITEEQGYKLDRILLNGKPFALTEENYKNGKLTLSKDLLAQSNTLEVSFVTQASYENYKNKGVEIKQPDTIIINANDIMLDFAAPASSGSVGKTVAIVFGCIAGAAVLAGGVAAIIFATKKRR